MKVVIIGNGIAGITAARHIRKLSENEVTVISAESTHFYSRTAIMYVYMGHQRYEDIKPYEDWFWAKNRISLIKGFATKADHDKKNVHLADGRLVPYDKLLIATGSKPNRIGWPGQDLDGVQSLYSLQDLELLEQNTAYAKTAVIVGGGLIGVELAEMLHSRRIKVHCIVREKKYWNNVLPLEESRMVSKHIIEHGIDLRHETELKEILPDNQGRVRAIRTNKDELIECQLVGLTIGVHPNLEFANAMGGIESDRGILVNNFLESNLQDVYAAGDCAQMRESRHGRSKIEPVWYTGKIMGKAAAFNICGMKAEYARGPWYNSAKFFELEYQVYGLCSNDPPPHHHSVFWKSTADKKSIRIVYDAKEGNRVIGFNLLGIRYRHDICDAWIKEEKNIRYVLENLSAANFDPEWTTRHEHELIKIYNEQHPGDHVKLKPLKKVKSLIFNQ